MNLMNLHYDLVCHVNARFEESDVIREEDITVIDWRKVVKTILSGLDESRLEEISDGAFFTDEEISRAMYSLVDKVDCELRDTYLKFSEELA